MTSTQLDGPDDVVSFLKHQHGQIKDLFEQVISGTGDERRQSFTDLRRLLAVHETAEEEVVHLRARWELHDGDPIVLARLHEEEQAKQVLSELEELDVDAEEFTTKVTALRDDVVAHAEAEENEEFARLREALDEGQLTRMRLAVKLAESMAPTRPHPGVELAGENALVGPFAAMVDRARDLITGKH